MNERIRHHMRGLPELERSAMNPDLEEIDGVLNGTGVSIHNDLWRCRGLRKLHIEIARVGRNLEILHCVFFPDPRFDLPLFGVDLVVSTAGISAAIVDLSPVGAELPKSVSQELQALRMPIFQNIRELPTWGTIFSPFVHFIRPENAEEESL